MANVNCLRCRFRHEDNGNCTAVGGFCTAVAAAHCPLLREYLDTGMTPEEVLPKDKAVIAHNIQADITMDIIRTNAAIIKDMIEHCEEDE